LIQHLQNADNSCEKHQAFRRELTDELAAQIKALNHELTAVRLQRQHTEKYKSENAFAHLSDDDVTALCNHIAPLVYMDEPDEYAKQFDNFVYGLMLIKLENSKRFSNCKKQLIDTAAKLGAKAHIPQIKEKLQLIKALQTDEFWKDIEITAFENVRVQLRGLIKFIIEDGKTGVVYTNLTDEIMEIRTGMVMEAAYDYNDYKLRVNRYIEENKNHLAIHKLRNNLPLNAMDYKDLERIFTGELGSAADYEREFGKTPFGLLVRKVAKLTPEAANEVFSGFINEQSLNQTQIVFIRKIIDYIMQNGYIESAAVLLTPPFDKPAGFIKLFDDIKQKRIVELLEQVKGNAMVVNL
jgi:type I restriction enzyme R subunit